MALLSLSSISMYFLVAQFAARYSISTALFFSLHIGQYNIISAAVVEASFTDACAEELSLALPTLSKSLRNLEARSQ